MYSLLIYWSISNLQLFFLYDHICCHNINYNLHINISQFSSNFSLELLIHISSSMTDLTSICPTVISNSDGFSFLSKSPPPHLSSSEVIQYFELNSWLESGTHPSLLLAPCWSPESSNSTTEIASEPIPTSYHCLVFGRGLIISFSGLLQQLPFWSFCQNFPHFSSASGILSGNELIIHLLKDLRCPHLPSPLS